MKKNTAKIKQTIVLAVMAISSFYIMIGCKPRTTDNSGNANATTNTTTIIQDNSTLVNTNAEVTPGTSSSGSTSDTRLAPTSDNTNSVNAIRSETSGSNTGSVSTATSGTVTSTAGTMSDADRSLLQQIQQGINQDASLSTTAKNIQLNAVNGKITLTGSVGSNQERDRINEIATRIAGSGNVDNRIEVQSAE